MRYFVGGLCVVLCVGCVGARRSDADLTYAVQTAFVNDPELLRNPRIEIESAAGVVHLRGTVPEQALKDRVERLARTVPGVRAVRNDVVVSYVFHERP